LSQVDHKKTVVMKWSVIKMGCLQTPSITSCLYGHQDKPQSPETKSHSEDSKHKTHQKASSAIPIFGITSNDTHVSFDTLGSDRSIDPSIDV
jgi:hypothetical protein